MVILQFPVETMVLASIQRKGGGGGDKEAAKPDNINDFLYNSQETSPEDKNTKGEE